MILFFRLISFLLAFLYVQYNFASGEKEQEQEPPASETTVSSESVVTIDLSGSIQEVTGPIDGIASTGDSNIQSLNDTGYIVYACDGSTPSELVILTRDIKSVEVKVSGRDSGLCFNARSSEPEYYMIRPSSESDFTDSLTEQPNLLAGLKTGENQQISETTMHMLLSLSKQRGEQTAFSTASPGLVLLSFGKQMCHGSVTSINKIDSHQLSSALLSLYLNGAGSENCRLVKKNRAEKDLWPDFSEGYRWLSKPHFVEDYPQTILRVAVVNATTLTVAGNPENKAIIQAVLEHLDDVSFSELHKIITGSDFSLKEQGTHRLISDVIYAIWTSNSGWKEAVEGFAVGKRLYRLAEIVSQNTTPAGMQAAAPTATTMTVSKTPGQLRSEHHPLLVEKLSTYAHKWDSLATALELLPREIKTIRASSCAGGMQNCLSTLLSDWLQERFEYAKKPTPEALLVALRSRLVSLGALANKIAPDLQRAVSSYQPDVPAPTGLSRNLTEDDLSDIMQIDNISSLAVNWKMLAMMLGIPSGEVEVISKNNPQDAFGNLTAALGIWLRCNTRMQPTVANLSAAVRNKPISFPLVANEIDRIFSTR